MEGQADRRILTQTDSKHDDNATRKIESVPLSLHGAAAVTSPHLPPARPVLLVMCTVTGCRLVAGRANLYLQELWRLGVTHLWVLWLRRQLQVSASDPK